MNNSNAEIQLKAIFDEAVDGIIIINQLGLIEDINAAASTLFDYPKEEVIGKNVHILMPKDYSIHHDEYVNKYVSTRIPKIIGIGREVVGKRKDGSFFPFWLSVSEVKLDDKVLFAGFIHDLSEIKNAEIKLRTLNEELEKKVVARTYELESVVNKLLSLNKQYENEIQSRVKIETKLIEREVELQNSLEKEKELGELKSRFVSLASHEFRTPLSTILSSVSLLGRYTENDQQHHREKHIQKIKSSVAHLTTILNDFLSINKLEEGKVQVTKEWFDVNHLLHELVEELETILKADQTIDIEVAQNVTQIYADRKIIKNMLINLLSNAIKYSNVGSAIRCQVIKSDSETTFSVIDEGIGIPKADQKHLFTKFFRASNSTHIEGTGLGLVIVKRYVDMLDGNIDFVSTLSEGSVFSVHIPFSILPS